MSRREFGCGSECGERQRAGVEMPQVWATDAPSGPRPIVHPGLRVLRLPKAMRFLPVRAPPRGAWPRPSCLRQRLGKPKSQHTEALVNKARDLGSHHGVRTG